MSIQVFCDESGTDEGSQTVAMAGYAMECPTQVDKFNEEWSEVLSHYGLDYFHMVECAHRRKQFSGPKWTQQLTSEVARRMIGIIKRRAAFGVAMSVDRADYEGLFNKEAQRAYGGIYTFCVQMILSGIGQWADRRKHTDPIAYFFEAGHPSQHEANYYMNQIATEEGSAHLKAFYRYGSHTFGLKRVVLPLQAADLLVWQWRKNTEREKSRKGSRLDFLSLAQLPTWFVRVTRENLEFVLADTAIKHAERLGQKGYSSEVVERFLASATPQEWRDSVEPISEEKPR